MQVITTNLKTVQYSLAIYKNYQATQFSVWNYDPIGVFKAQLQRTNNEY